MQIAGNVFIYKLIKNLIKKKSFQRIFWAVCSVLKALDILKNNVNIEISFPHKKNYNFITCIIDYPSDIYDISCTMFLRILFLLYFEGIRNLSEILFNSLIFVY